MQRLLACDDCRQVRAALAYNPHTDATVLANLARTDFDKDVVIIANRNLRDRNHTESVADGLRTIV